MDDQIDEKSDGRTPKPPKPPKTAEELAAIAYLDKLRVGEGEEKPSDLPLACVVKIVDYEEIPKANEQYALATVEGRDGRRWRMCIRRYYLETGMRALFVSEDAAVPVDDERFANMDVCKLHDRVYKFGFGVKVRRKVPFVKRNVYCNNCGVLYPIDDFHELLDAKVGDVCGAALHLESAAELHRQAAMPRPKKSVVPQPVSKPKANTMKDDFLAKIRLHRKRFGW